jgi:hypothetical protein
MQCLKAQMIIVSYLSERRYTGKFYQSEFRRGLPQQQPCLLQVSLELPSSRTYSLFTKVLGGILSSQSKVLWKLFIESSSKFTLNYLDPFLDFFLLAFPVAFIFHGNIKNFEESFTPN